MNSFFLPEDRPDRHHHPSFKILNLFFSLYSQQKGLQKLHQSHPYLSFHPNIQSMDFNNQYGFQLHSTDPFHCKYTELCISKLLRIFREDHAHQLVAIAFLGHKPDGYILVVDHINDIKTDNRVENLQIVTARFNVYKTQKKYSSQYKGVCWHKYTKKWQASIYINGKIKYLGLFIDENEAHLTYQNALKNI